MMRTIEIFMVSVILFSALLISSYFAVLPSPRSVSGLNLRELALSTLETLDANGDLTRTAFCSNEDPSWDSLQNALVSSLPPNIAYNLTVYDVVTSNPGQVTYYLVHSLSDGENDLGADSAASSYVVQSPKVTFMATPQKIGESFSKEITLYILNCVDASGWWITGYTAQSLASDLRNLLSPYFQTTVLVNTTGEFGLLLNGTSLQGGTVQDAVVVNTFGEAVPIPQGYFMSQGYDGSHASYARFDYLLGQRIRQYNWTWVSIVGYPFYYVTNTAAFSTAQNGWGIYGMRRVGESGFMAFLRGLDGQSYYYNPQWITGSPGVVQLTWNASYYSNYYGIYPSPYQTASRALPNWILSAYHLTVAPHHYIFNIVNNWISGATFSHQNGGAFTAIGLARIPDVRVTALGLLQYYRPSIYKSELGASGTSKLIVLQLAQQGGA